MEQNYVTSLPGCEEVWEVPKPHNWPPPPEPVVEQITSPPIVQSPLTAQPPTFAPAHDGVVRSWPPQAPSAYRTLHSIGWKRSCFHDLSCFMFQTPMHEWRASLNLLSGHHPLLQCPRTTDNCLKDFCCVRIRKKHALTALQHLVLLKQVKTINKTVIYILTLV